MSGGMALGYLPPAAALLPLDVTTIPRDGGLSGDGDLDFGFGFGFGFEAPGSGGVAGLLCAFMGGLEAGDWLAEWLGFGFWMCE